ncbi:MAG TPA: DUF4142 domain-containing protein, partial [Chitinophagaceae bacterium]|nr:DUF4142 domain-containing protein [Chitinophagaceae bacterium]
NDKNDRKFDDKNKEQLAAFVVDEVANCYNELQLAALAAQKSSHTDIKEMAAAMAAGDSSLLERLKVYATKNNFSIPANGTKEAKEEYTRLAVIPEAQFDRKWIDLLMDKHKKTIARFETALLQLPDEAMKNLVQEALPVTRRRYDKLMQYHHKV